MKRIFLASIKSTHSSKYMTTKQTTFTGYMLECLMEGVLLKLPGLLHKIEVVSIDYRTYGDWFSN